MILMTQMLQISLIIKVTCKSNSTWPALNVCIYGHLSHVNTLQLRNILTATLHCIKAHNQDASIFVKVVERVNLPLRGCGHICRLWELEAF